MRIISITNQKGGCGKTTTAVNLAASLANNGKKVLLIDLDPQSHATAGLNIESSLSIYNVLSKLTNKKAGFEDIIQNLGPNLDIAPSSIVLSTLEQELAYEIGRESRLIDTLSAFKGNYDYCLIDCPPNLGILTVNALRATDEIIIPVEASRFSLEGLKQLISIIDLVKDRLNHVVEYRVLVANFDSRLRHSFIMLERIKSAFGSRMFGTIIHVNVKLKEAQNQGTHIFKYDKYCRGAKDYYSLSREIITQDKATGHEVTMSQIKEKMAEAIKENLPGLTEVVFSLAAKDAKEIYVVGDFNDWKIDDNSRMLEHDGTWTKSLSLLSGNYRYRFVMDGKWTDDPNNSNRAMNPYGQMDSLLEVKG
ncbi:MAG: AAA family ATPase [Candidatus Omnitrophota bacterium]|nr:AAA family ATPase [Candidatus Omnitrophota bacterium]MBU1929066.1 AAA family ATPase [Candidatus Omnitrophota bacterium]MBU1929183.1 AAA family ATPase [Candidatus Omnitrophota bacterium]MBU2035063.1 AAA family ATPase [Candidatus Omnitrophota bacterium]MBU2220999.1 AAA family ATPase [Candidatus Omnitrophota bacterium]